MSFKGTHDARKEGMKEPVSHRTICSSNCARFAASLPFLCEIDHREGKNDKTPANVLGPVP